MRRRIIATLAAATLGVGLIPSAAQAEASPAGVAPAAAKAKAKARTTMVRVGTFNVRTARARSDKRTWLQRVPDVSREILSRNPGVVALQELGPGRADGKKAKLKGAQRQTTSLTSTLRRLGGGRYRLVRSTSYVAPGSSHGTQGARLLYDSKRFALKSTCREYTGKKAYNPSCSFDLPLAAGDSRKHLRSAAYARFANRRTGQQFWVVSAHLDNRHSKSKAKEAVYNRLRVRQAAYIASVMARVNTQRLPVVFGGDINSWRTDRGRYAPFRAFVARGYTCSSSARTALNLAYPTVNHWRVTLRRSKASKAPRLDVVMVKGAKSIRRHENVTSRVDRARPSDHNLVVADLGL